MSFIRLRKKSLKKNLFKLINQVKSSHIKKQVTCPKEWYGNDYGGFYLNPYLISYNGIVYSFGVGEDLSFDLALIKNHGCLVFAFDPTPKSINWIKKQKKLQNFDFLPYGIAKESGIVKFNLPKNQSHVSGSVINHKNVTDEYSINVEMKSIDDIKELFYHEHLDVLKMDIEGSEYEVVDEILDSGIDINQFAIEIHERFFSDGITKTKLLVESMNKNGYKIFAISDSYKEISFVKEILL
ncbi:MAG: FkbM family methyltransferase [Bacteroidota bacterium]